MDFRSISRRLGRAAILLVLFPAVALAYPGLLDPAFGTEGLVQSKLAYGAYMDTLPGASGIARQADGKLVVAGSTGVVLGAVGASRFGIARYNTDGSLDTAFGNQGRVNGGPAVGFANGVLVDGNGRIVVFGSALDLLTGASAIALARFLPDGTPDVTFGSGGVVTSAIGLNSAARAARIDAIGRIVVAGLFSVSAGLVQGYAVARFDGSGVLDATFGNSGVTTFGLGAFVESAFAMALDAQGRIVVAGTSGTSSGGVARLLATGQLDPSFGTGGTVMIGTSPGAFRAVALDSAGRIVVAGWIGSSNAQQMATARVNDNGTVDATYGTGGIAFAGFPAAFPLMSAAYAISIEAGDRILVGGESGPSNPSTFAFARFLADGTLDATFGSAGRQTVVLAGSGGSSPSGVRGLVTGSGGTTYFAGFGLSRFALGAIDAAGNPVPGFNAGNASTPVTTPATFVTGTASTNWQAVAAQPDGRIVAAGGASFSTSNFTAITRRLATGAADPSFGGTGELTVQTVDGSGSARALAIDATGRVVVAGTTGVAGFSRFSLLRFLANGTRDAAFGANGEVATSFGAGEAMANAIAIDGNARLVVGGSYNDGNAKRLALARYLDSGSLDPGFGTGGRVTLTLSGNSAEILALKIDASGRIVVAGRDYASGAALLARFDNAGVLDAAFGTAGILSIAGTNARLSALAFDAAGRIHAVGAANDGAGKLANLVVRVTDTGQPATPQGTAGVILVAGTAPSELRGIALDSQGRILVAGHSVGRLLLARLDPATLGLDPAYGANAGVTIAGTLAGGNLVDTPRAANAMTLQADGAVVLAGRDKDYLNEDVALIARFAAATPAGKVPLVVTRVGSGTVKSSPAGLDCGDLCVADFATGTAVTMTATPAAGWRFDGWTGACTGTGSACLVTLDAARSATATFAEGAALPSGSRFANLATRMQVLTGDDVLIGGFILGGGTPRTVAVRARGASLAPAGLTGLLPDPRIDLFAGQTVLESNDNWAAAVNVADIVASGFAPSDGTEAAILRTLAPGAYTVVVSGAPATGIGIVEIFDTDPLDGRLVNISTRGRVMTGNDVMIAGFVIQGDQPQTVIVRARGPSLTQSGVVGVLPNPLLQLFSGSTQIAVNDNWQDSPEAAAAISAAGYAPLHPLESAIRITLNPGAYTAIVSGVGGRTGVAIVEVFAQ